MARSRPFLRAAPRALRALLVGCGASPLAVALCAGLAAAPRGALAAEPTAPAVPVAAADRAERKERVERGRYLVETGGCGDCHTPWKTGPRGPEPDTARLLSGHPESLRMPPPPRLPAGPWAVVASATNTAWSGPWGVSFTANLTPDEETGLGLWTARQFADTMRTGRHLGIGRPVLPPMPIPAYRHFRDEDLQAMFAYLRSLPPIRNRVPAPLPPGAGGKGGK